MITRHTRTTIAIGLCTILVAAAATVSANPNAWSYTHPDAWPGVCQSGSAQSPIDFSLRQHRGHEHRHHMKTSTPLFDGEYVDDESLAPIRLSDGCVVTNGVQGLTITNTGHSIIGTLHSFKKRQAGDSSPSNAAFSSSTCTVINPLNKQQYIFDHLAVHRKAEHLFLGHRLDMELHLTFRSGETDSEAEDKKIMMIAVPLIAVKDTKHETGSKFLSLLLDSCKKLPSKTLSNVTVVPKDLDTIDKKKDNTFSIQHMLPTNDEGYMAYHGSLTTPPCTENVDWFVFSHPAFVPLKDVRSFSIAMEGASRGFSNTGNARPTQPLNKRTIRRFLDPTVTERSSGFDDGMAKLSKGAGLEAKKLSKADAAGDDDDASAPSTISEETSFGTIGGAVVLLVVALVVYGRIRQSMSGERKSVGVDYSRVNTSLNSRSGSKASYGGTADADDSIA